MSSVLTSRNDGKVERTEWLNVSQTPRVSDIRLEKSSSWQRFCRGLLFRQLRGIQGDQLTITDVDGRQEFGSVVHAASRGKIAIRNPRVYSSLVRGGSLAAAEAYLRGDWDTDDLTNTLRIFARNADVLVPMDRWSTRIMGPWRSLWMWSRRNTRAGSRRNISAHYDLSNDFFALMLDPSMTYSSGIFERPDATLEDASTAKYDRICRKLRLLPTDHVLEIGTGWGGFAMHAAKNYGCRVTTTTVSQEQFQLARTRIREAGLEDRIELLLKDYRDLEGQFDKAVSIEMIEAVGEHMFDTYFRQCARLVKNTGAMVLQAITIPDERYDSYRNSVDFINRYVFPGGFLPSLSAMSRSVRSVTDFRLVDQYDFAPDYARTLACWKANFWDHIQQVRNLGFDDRFIRTWHYYLCYCEAGFAEQQIDVSQIMLARPQWQGDV